jgi:hypothetical protein
MEKFSISNAGNCSCKQQQLVRGSNEKRAVLKLTKNIQ